MSRIRKAGMLMILLAFPAFFFLFLKFFGTNHYDLPYYYPQRDSKGSVLVVDGDTLYYQLNGVIGVLTDAADTVFSERLDKWNTAFILGGKDPSINERLRRISERLVERTVHLERTQFIISDSLWDGPFGDTSRVLRIASAVASENRLKELLKVDTIPADKETFLPKTSLVLVDGHRRIRGYYDLLDPQEFDRVIAEMKVLEHQDKVSKP
jgi:protein SCO1/2